MDYVAPDTQREVLNLLEYSKEIVIRYITTRDAQFLQLTMHDDETGTPDIP